MRILYVSLHSVLEYDEVRLFRSLGHEVVSLGALYGGRMAEPLRDNLAATPAELDLYDQFEAMGGRYVYSGAPTSSTHLPDGFVELFDLVVVMHDLMFIEHHWAKLSRRPVVWRTIGQDGPGWEELAAVLKTWGMHPVRYSPTERLRSNYCGETALIRFGKCAEDYGPWIGDGGAVLNFTNSFAQRYPTEYGAFRAATSDVPTQLGGMHNEAEPDWIGLVDQAEQRRRYNAAAAYLYCSGWTIPYTLNFMEALISGVPMLCLHPDPCPALLEVPSLLSDGAGLATGDIDTAARSLASILSNREDAQVLSEAARRRGLELFSYEVVGPQWQALFDRIG